MAEAVEALRLRANPLSQRPFLGSSKKINHIKALQAGLAAQPLPCLKVEGGALAVMKRLLMLVLLLNSILLIQACGRPVPEEDPCHFVVNQKGQRVSWGGQTIRMFVHDSVPAIYRDAIREAADVWNDKLGERVLEVSIGATGPVAPTRDGYSTINYLDTWEENKSNEQARTTVYWTGSQVYEADIRINNKNFDFYVGDEEPDFSKVHMKSLMVHEFGHVLGLGHIEEKSSVMYPTLLNGLVRTDLSFVDLSSVRCEYN